MVDMSNVEINKLKKVTVVLGEKKKRKIVLKNIVENNKKEAVYVSTGLFNKFLFLLENGKLDDLKVLVLDDSFNKHSVVEKLNFIKILFEFIEDSDFKIILGTLSMDMVIVLENMVSNFKLNNDCECYCLEANKNE